MFYGKYRELCALKGVSPSTAAVRAGISKSTVSVWKSKFDQGIDVDPDQQTIDKICAYFEISEAELRGFGDEGIKKEPILPDRLTDKQRQVIFKILSIPADELDKKLDTLNGVLDL